MRFPTITIRSFAVGVLATVALGGLGGLAAVEFGLVPANADTPPSAIEAWAAKTSLNRTIARESAAYRPPSVVTNADLAHGVDLYAANCAFCHGAANAKPSVAARGFHVPAPQLAKDSEWKTPEAHAFWRLKHGIRMTAMPAFGGTLSDAQLWQITAFLTDMKSLPPAIEAKWKAVPSAS